MANGGGSFMRWIKDTKTIVAFLSSIFAIVITSGFWRYVEPSITMGDKVYHNTKQITALTDSDVVIQHRIDELTWGMRWVICRREFDDSLRVAGKLDASTPRANGCEWIKYQAPTLFVR